MALVRKVPDTIDTTLSTRVRREYSDLDANFVAKPGTVFEDGVRRGDIYKKADIRSIEQSIQNIVLTNHYEKPFQPFFGSNLRRLLFELNTTIGEYDVTQTIVRSIEKDEPRVIVERVDLYDLGAAQPVPRGIRNVFFYSKKSNSDAHSLSVIIYCKIRNTGQDITTTVNMNRLR